MALANVAELLVSFGYRVITCDWDLEAPGLERYFVVNNADREQYRRSMDEYLEWPGLVDLLVEYKETLSRPADPTATPGRDAHGFAQLGDLWLRRPSSYARTANEHRSVPGSLRLLTAGRRRGEWQRKYGDAVRRFDWQQFYDQWAGDAYMDFFRRDLVGEKGMDGAADLLLIRQPDRRDRAGRRVHAPPRRPRAGAHRGERSEHGGRQVDGPDAHRSAAGQGPRRADPRGPAHRLRIEQTAQTKELVEFRRQFIDEFGAALATHTTNPEALAIATEIPYMPYYSYHERVVARENEVSASRISTRSTAPLPTPSSTTACGRSCCASGRPRASRPRPPTVDGLPTRRGTTPFRRATAAAPGGARHCGAGVAAQGAGTRAPHASGSVFRARRERHPGTVSYARGSSPRPVCRRIVHYAPDRITRSCVWCTHGRSSSRATPPSRSPSCQRSSSRPPMCRRSTPRADADRPDLQGPVH